jgi:hypothetical protein
LPRLDPLPPLLLLRDPPPPRDSPPPPLLRDTPPLVRGALSVARLTLPRLSLRASERSRTIGGLNRIGWLRS